MDKLFFRNMDNFTFQVGELSHSVEQVYVIGDYLWVTEFVNCIIKNTDCILTECELHNAVYDNYDREYLVTVANGEVYVEKFYNNNAYLDLHADNDTVVMISDDIHFEAIKKLNQEITYVVEFDNEDCASCEYKDECEDVNEEDTLNINPSRHSLCFHRQSADGSEVTVEISSEDTEFVRELLERFLCEGCDD